MKDGGRIRRAEKSTCEALQLPRPSQLVEPLGIPLLADGQRYLHIDLDEVPLWQESTGHPAIVSGHR